MATANCTSCARTPEQEAAIDTAMKHLDQLLFARRASRVHGQIVVQTSQPQELKIHG